VKRLEMVPNGWPCTFKDCPPGYFVWQGNLCLMSDYGDNAGKRNAYCDSGEYFLGGVTTTQERDGLAVQPVVPRWVEVDE